MSTSDHHVDGSVVLDSEIPFGAIKTAEQNIQLAIDPSEELTKKRYEWFSNETRFDETLLDDTVEAGIRVETGGSGTDVARIGSAYAGQYVSQTLAQPGLGLVVDDDIVYTDGKGRAYLTHGEIYSGVFWWDPVNDEVETGIGTHLHTGGWDFFVRSLNQHIGDSPIPQEDWNKDKFDNTGSFVADPSNGYIQNYPYTWYNQGPLGFGLVDPHADRLKVAVKEVIEGRPSIDTPNLPPHLVVRDAGASSPVGVELGGMQYTLYGASELNVEQRRTPVSRFTADNYVSTEKVTVENELAIDPAEGGAVGEPLYAIKRASDGRDNRVTPGIIDTDFDNPVYLLYYDEFDPDTALDNGLAGFHEPNSTLQPPETRVLVNTECTGYTPTEAISRGWQKVDGGKRDVDPRSATSDDRLPIGATRVVTAVHDGAAATASPISQSVVEGF